MNRLREYLASPLLFRERGCDSRLTVYVQRLSYERSCADAVIRLSKRRLSNYAILAASAAWLVVEGKSGVLCKDAHCKIAKLVHDWVASNASITLPWSSHCLPDPPGAAVPVRSDTGFESAWSIID
mgnify:CR=1 FL=1